MAHVTIVNGVRSPSEVMAEMLKIAPDLATMLSPIYNTALYAAPETWLHIWHSLANLMNKHVVNHPESRRLAYCMNTFWLTNKDIQEIRG